MSRPILGGSADVSSIVRFVDATDGTPEESVTSATAGLALWYRREGAAAVAIEAEDLAGADSDHADGGLCHLGDGYYRLDLPDAAVLAGSAGVLVGGAADGMTVIGAYHAIDPPADLRLWKGESPAALTDTDKVQSSVQHKEPTLDFTATEKTSISTQTRITVTPVQVTVGAGEIADAAIVAYQHAAFVRTLTILDSLDAPVDLSGKSLVFSVYLPGRPQAVLWSLTSADGEITVAGDDNNQVTLTDDDEHMGTAGLYRWALWNTTDDTLVGRGPLTIEEEADAS